MLMLQRIILTVGLVVGLSQLAAAVTGDLEQLIRQQQYDEAWALAQEHRFELEGEVSFDFPYGLAALETGNFSEGLFALERVIMQRPGHTRARLELARGYYLTDDDERARHHFERARNQDPPPTVVATIDRYLQRIDQRAEEQEFRFSGSIGSSLGYDTNVNSGTSADEISINFLGLTGTSPVPDESKPKDDVFTRIFGDARVERPLNDQWTAFAVADGEARLHLDESDFNTLRVGVRAGARWRDGPLARTLSLRTQRFFIDGDGFQTLYGASLNTQEVLSETRLATYGFDYALLDHDDNEDSNAHLMIVSVGEVRMWPQLPLTPTTNVSAFAGPVIAREDSAQAKNNTQRFQTGFNLLAQVQLAPDWRLSTRGQYRLSQYSGQQIVFGNDRRRDHFSQVALSADWQPMTALQVTPRMEYRHNSSNIDPYSYDRFVAELQTRYRF